MAVPAAWLCPRVLCCSARLVRRPVRNPLRHDHPHARPLQEAWHWSQPQPQQKELQLQELALPETVSEEVPGSPERTRAPSCAAPTWHCLAWCRAWHAACGLAPARACVHAPAPRLSTTGPLATLTLTLWLLRLCAATASASAAAGTATTATAPTVSTTSSTSKCAAKPWRPSWSATLMPSGPKSRCLLRHMHVARRQLCGASSCVWSRPASAAGHASSWPRARLVRCFAWRAVLRGALLHGALFCVARGAGGAGARTHQGLQLQEERVPQEVLRVLPGGRVLLRGLQVHRVQELRGGWGGGQAGQLRAHGPVLWLLRGPGMCALKGIPRGCGPVMCGP